MSEFNDRFGGSAIQPSDVAYHEFTSDQDELLQWPPYATKDNLLAKVTNFNPLRAGLTLFMPDAREATPGETVLFYNNSAFPYVVASNSGATITTVEMGARRLVMLTYNETRDGDWISTILGVGTGALDIAGSAGAGLRTVGTRLNVAYPVVTVNSSRSIAEGDRDKVIVWTGGAGILALPPASYLTDFNIEIRNQGTGVLTLQPTGGQLIDGVADIIINVDESLWLHSASNLNFWSTIGRGRATQFAFTQLQKTITGGDVVLTLTEAANVVQTYNGALISNVDVIFPSIVQVYFVSNQTTGPFNLRFRNVGPGSSVSLAQGQSAILFSDGINVTNAATTTSGVEQVAYGPGTVDAPSVSINGLNNGFFSPASGAVSFAASGVEVVKLTESGLEVETDANPTFGVKAIAGDAFASIDRPAGFAGGVAVKSDTLQRWTFGADNSPESGGNAGSDFALSRYADDGTYLDSPLRVDRNSGLVRDLGAVGSLQIFIGPPTTRIGVLYLDGALVSRVTFAALWAYAQTTDPVTELQWNLDGYSGRFSVGNGTTTFRLPDIRGVFVRGLDSGRGFDATREWGRFQDQVVLSHIHNIIDPGHVHGVTDPRHAHGVNDPSHAHGVSDPTHVHPYQYAGAGQGQPPQANASTNTGGTSYTSAAATGIAIQAALTGVSIQTALTGITVNSALTGITVGATGLSDGHPRNQAYPIYVRY